MKTSILAGLVALVVGASSAEGQAVEPYGLRSAAMAPNGLFGNWAFGPVRPHVVDAGKRSVSALVFSTIFMSFGLGIDKLNAAQCNSKTICTMHNPVQAGTGFAFLGALVGAVGPEYRSKCTRSGRALLGILGATIGISTASAITGERMLTAKSGDPATWRTMGSALAGLSLGSGIVTAIC